MPKTRALPTGKRVVLIMLFCRRWLTIWRASRGARPRDLPPTLANLTPQAYNSIQYDANHSLWNNIEERKLDIQFFHVGMGFRRRVRMFSLDASTQQAREIHFRPELFKYNDAGVDTRQLEGQSDLGFAGFRVFKAPELARRDIVAFLGASYFRAVDSTYQYGLSARGLAVDTFTDTPEEFPDFTSFWFETVKGTPRCLPFTRCWTARASLAPTSSPSTADTRLSWTWKTTCTPARISNSWVSRR